MNYKKEYTEAELLDKAENACAASEQSAADIRDKLYRWGCSDRRVIEQIIDHLMDNDFINEQRYVKAYVHDKVNYQGWGRQKLSAMLSAKGIDSKTISNALDEIDEDIYNAKLQAAIRTKLAQLSEDDEHLLEKVVRFCMQRGYTYEEIKRHINL